MATNLLSANVSSYETDASGWTATGGTLSSVTSGGVNPLGAAIQTGTRCCQLYAPTAGTVTKTTVADTTVTPGAEYAFREIVGCVGGTTIAYGSIIWFDAANAQIGTPVDGPSIAVPVTTDTASLRGVASYGVAPVGAVKAKVQVTATSPGGEWALVSDKAEFLSEPNRPGNLLTTEDYSGEMRGRTMVCDLPWTVGDVNAVFPPGASPDYDLDGYWMETFTPVSTGQAATAVIDRNIPVTPGNVYAYGLVFAVQKNATPGPVELVYRPKVLWLNSAHEPVSSSAEDPMAAVTTPSLQAGGKTIVWSSRAARAPEGAAYARVGVEIKHTDSGAALYGVDKLYFQPGELEYELTTKNATGSVDLTVYYRPDPAPATWSVTRFLSDGTAAPVRHTSGDLVSAPYTPDTQMVEDYEVPMGERVWYRIAWGGTSISTATVAGPTLADPDYVWLKSPGIPATNTLVMMESAPEWSRAARQTLTDIVGRSTPIAVFDVRSSRSGELSVFVWDRHSNDLLNKLLDSGAVALIQAAPEYALPPNLYVSIGDSKAEPLSADAKEPGWRWALPITEVDRPIGGIKGSASRTWDMVEDAASWFDVFNSYETWEEVLITEV